MLQFLKWLLGFGPARLSYWWEGLNFYVKWSDSRTGEEYRLYKCTCKIIENQQENTDYGIPEEADPEDLEDDNYEEDEGWIT